MKKILVTGANGFVGKHLLRELSSNGYDILAVGGSQVSDIENFEAGQQYIKLNLTNPNESQKIDFSDITGVVHLAGLAAVGPSFERPMKYVDVNVGIESNLFEEALKQKANPKFIIVSSGTLYDPKETQPLTEVSRVLPNSPYAVSKIGQEQMAQYYSTRGFEVIIARPFNHIGPGQGLGFIVPDIAKQIVIAEKSGNKEIMVGNLDARRDYTDVREIVRAYRLLLESGISDEIYNICSSTPRSGHDILKEICKIANIEPEIKLDSSKMRPSDTPSICGSHEKLTEATGWVPIKTLEETLIDVIDDWRSQL
jgi:GDP-4-dehydro-6-deoxy-D-mannose reductase